MNSKITQESTSAISIFAPTRTPAVGGVTGQFGKATEEEPIFCSNNHVISTTITQKSTAKCCVGWVVGDAGSYGADKSYYAVEENEQSGAKVIYQNETYEPGNKIGFENG
jgi:hypothetical protein